MRRGTTPTITMELPKDIQISDVTEAVFSISQNCKEIIRKQLADMTPNAEQNAFSVRLSQNDTLRLREGVISMQLKVKIRDDVFASEIVPGNAFQVLNEDVI